MMPPSNPSSSKAFGLPRTLPVGSGPLSTLSPLSTMSPLSPVDVNARNSEGETALTFALKNEQLDMIKVLVEKGKADINGQNADGNTELMLAARRGQTRMVKLLVELGANVHLRYVFVSCRVVSG